MDETTNSFRIPNTEHVVSLPKNINLQSIVCVSIHDYTKSNCKVTIRYIADGFNTVSSRAKSNDTNNMQERIYSCIIENDGIIRQSDIYSKVRCTKDELDNCITISAA